MHGDSWFVGDVSFQTEKEARDYRMKQTITERHLERMMSEAADLDGPMNLAGFYYLGHLVSEERARVSLAFSAMIMDYAKRHGLSVRSPVKEINN